MENSRSWLRSLAGAHLLLAKSESGCTGGNVTGKVVPTLLSPPLSKLGHVAGLLRAEGKGALAMYFLPTTEQLQLGFSCACESTCSLVGTGRSRRVSHLSSEVGCSPWTPHLPALESLSKAASCGLSLSLLNLLILPGIGFSSQ